MSLDNQGATHLRMLDSDMRIVGDDKWLDLIRLLWAPFVVDAPVGLDGGIEEFRIEPLTSGDWRLRTPLRDLAPLSPWPLLDNLRNQLTTTAFLVARDVAPLHASFIAKESTGILIVGPPYSGKTTLSLALLSRGGAHSSDDLAPVEISSGRVRPFPKPISIRDVAMWRELRARWRVPGWLPPPTDRALAPASVFPQATLVPIELVLFPTFDVEAEPSITPLSAAAAAARCLQNCHAPERTPSHVEALTRLCAGASSYELRYPSTEAALDLLGPLL